MSSPQTGRITYLSPPASVNMGDQWFEIANLDHFWIMRRFQVLTKLADDLVRGATSVAEVGCGHGLLQRQIEDHYQRQVTGFDLNEVALRQTASRTSAVCCYNLFHQDVDYKGRFDLVFLFDVLEHLDDEDAFLKAIQFHMTAKGRIVVNVPALQTLYSNYDKAVGHVRRYNIAGLRRVAERNGNEDRRVELLGTVYDASAAAPQGLAVGAVAGKHHLIGFRLRRIIDESHVIAAVADGAHASTHIGFFTHGGSRAGGLTDKAHGDGGRTNNSRDGRGGVHWQSRL